jgi:hypothetical protein
MIGIDGVRFPIGGQQRCLRLTWAALLALSDEWGEGFERRISEAIETRNLRDLATIVEVCGGPSRAEVIAASPDIMPLIGCIETCWNWAYLGFESARVFEAARKKEREREEARERAGDKVRIEKKLSRFLSYFGFDMQSRTR